MYESSSEQVLLWVNETKIGLVLGFRNFINAAVKLVTEGECISEELKH